MEGCRAAFEDRWLLGIERLDGEFFNSGNGVAAWIFSRTNFKCRGRLQIAEGSPQRLGIADGDFIRLRETSGVKNQSYD